MNLRTRFSTTVSRGWWIKVQTKLPTCTYYFGPFDSEQEAEHLHAGYVDDLTREGAKGIVVDIRRWTPNQLTVYSLE